ncbi:alpha-mannosidase 2 [Parasteatoda tepidariorum]|uniref:alpha-mannosidase 2 n=1 Tax=Parasteatoda tepidariorum TaxID=114398 RepID=UPI001C720869|nr:alpha-mannosidase 2 [Parasteatoda tepidariorum]
MLTRFHRRFRSKALLSILFTGIVLITLSYYLPIHSQEDFGLLPRPSSSPPWWHRLWTTTSDACKVGTPKPSSPRIDTGDVYPNLDFGVPDNRAIGFWNEELESRYRKIRNTWKELPLEVIVVPHSHVDPGWLRTYDDYFSNSVTHILDNMVSFLNKTKDFRFIWSEISYFADWWDKQTEQTRKTVRALLDRKQLEIVTGGWVMTDEATTSYFSIIDQLIEGHQWLKQFTQSIPQSGWSVDVFGHSASVPYILSASGISETVILRTHYSWKAFLAKARSFDFYWEQPFDAPRTLCHMAPSDLYSFKYTCGPDPFSCLKYDFRKVGGEYSESTADEITDSNVELKASYLISQYGRYASLFSHNVLLVPLGDDFRYNLYMEWVQQYENYQKLFDFINNKKEWNARMRFGTVSDYFNTVKKRLDQSLSNTSLSSIVGDFMPYADIYADATPSYWTGYYSTRPFYKKLSQELEHWLRTSEILYSLAKTKIDVSAKYIFTKDYKLLMSARRKLALFQHHDAVTGTSKEDVMADYGQKLHTGVIDAMTVTSHVTQMLLMENKNDGSTWTSQIFPEAYRPSWNEQTKHLRLQIPEEGRKIVLFNSLTFEHSEVIRLKVKRSEIRVLDSTGKQVMSQINPIWNDPLVMSNNLYELVFVATVKPLSYSVYSIVQVDDKNSDNSIKSTISLYLKDDLSTTLKHSVFNFEKPVDENINLESSQLLVTFSSTGVLKEVYNKRSKKSQSINSDFRAYVPKEYRSGAYLFEPTSNEPMAVSNLTNHFPMLCIVRGPVLSELIIVYHNFLKVTFRVYNFAASPTGLQIEVSPDLSNLPRDVELVMRISSDLKNSGNFFTDSNGLQMLKRQYVPKLPVQANYYPTTSAIYIEDERSRLSLLVPHSHGATSPNHGTIELMIDRRMRTDDSRGMGEGVMDNRPISTTFWLVPESITNQNQIPPSLTRESFLLSLTLQYPMIILLEDGGDTRLRKSDLSFLSTSWSADVHLVNMRNLPLETNYRLPSNNSLMIIHERFGSCKSEGFVDAIVSNSKKASFSEVKLSSAIKTTLTGTASFTEENYVSTSKLQSCKLVFN